MTSIAIVLIVLGVFFLFMGAVGLVRFPDFYSRMHAAGKCDTLGSLLLLTGFACYNGATLASVKMLAIAFFVFITSPTATHSIARVALKYQMCPSTKENQ
tara:strand:- start:136 stop:435 length:300 start_codon:yes stop_codon:yes gene_type:complete